jgi:hypothetical protein
MARVAEDPISRFFTQPQSERINQIELRQVNAPDCSCINCGHQNPMTNLSPMVMLIISCILLERKDLQLQ